MEIMRVLLQVVLNHEDPYSIWPADREIVPGWKNAGMAGTKSECLECSKEVWTDAATQSSQADGWLISSG